MTAHHHEAHSTAKPGPECLVRLVAGELEREKKIEAITIHRARRAVSIATIGNVADPVLSEKMGVAILESDQSKQRSFCGLLDGKEDCCRCAAPLSGEEQGRFTVQQTQEEVTVARVTCPTARKLWRWRDLPLPRVVQRDVEFLEDEHHVDEWKGQLVAAAACGLSGLLGFYWGHHSSAGLGAFLLSYLAGGWFAAEEVWERLRQRAVDVHFLMLAVAVGSASIGAWAEGATLLFLFSLSGALEHFALGRTQREIKSLFREAPKVAVVLDAEGHETETPVELLRPGMRLLLKPGAQFPVDAEVLKGTTASDESNLTGEAVPVEKSVGDTVLAGTMNLWGAIEAVVLRPAAESSLSKIIHLIREAQQRKAPAQQFTDRFGAWYTYAVLGLTLVMFFVWWLGSGLSAFASHDDTRSAFYRAMTLLVVASPCALVLSIPSAVLAAIAWGARHGILFRGGAAVEKLAAVRVVAMDKTGTLTTGELRVASVESFPAGREQEVAQLAFSLERLSTHPLARAITRHGKQTGITPLEVEQFESRTGMGLQARCLGSVCRLGRREWVAELGHGLEQGRVSPTEAGHSEVWVAGNGFLGRVLLRDDLRSESAAVVEALRGEGLQTVVLTGDRQQAAEHLRQALGVDDVRAELKPEQKVEAIRQLSQGGVPVAMVGDGVNDAPSLAAAHVGVAMGARGADAALEQAEVVLMHDRLENFLNAFRLSQRARSIIRQNLVISLGTVLVLVVFALWGRIPLTLGVVGHEGSTVVVVMNSLRLLLGGVPVPAAAPTERKTNL